MAFLRFCSIFWQDTLSWWDRNPCLIIKLPPWDQQCGTQNGFDFDTYKQGMTQDPLQQENSKIEKSHISSCATFCSWQKI